MLSVPLFTLGLQMQLRPQAPATSAMALAARDSQMQPAAVPARARIAVMQEQSVYSPEYDTFVALDADGAAVPLELEEKEKLYLECLDSFYNEGGKQVLSNEDFDKLKLDLDFSTSRVALFSKDEIKYVIANKRFKQGQAIMGDDEYDALRLKLKKEGSVVALHDSPTCKLDTGVCKMDLRVDKGKTRLLYFPGVAGGVVLGCEICYWTLGIDPLLSLVISAVPAYFFGKFFTENIFVQQPKVTQAPCPECSQLLTIYFGDLFNVQTDGIAGAAMAPSPEIEVQCSQCKSTLIANRDDMLLTSLPKI